MFTPFWRLEESLWMSGLDVLQAHLATNARMIFPAPVGILEASHIVETLREAPEWRSIDISERSQARLEDTIILAYRIQGLRDHGASYQAYCSSTYVQTEGQWKLLVHQRTPID